MILKHSEELFVLMNMKPSLCAALVPKFRGKQSHSSTVVVFKSDDEVRRIRRIFSLGWTFLQLIAKHKFTYNCMHNLLQNVGGKTPTTRKRISIVAFSIQWFIVARKSNHGPTKVDHRLFKEIQNEPVYWV
jgi:hypothetical protein